MHWLKKDNSQDHYVLDVPNSEFQWIKLCGWLMSNMMLNTSCMLIHLLLGVIYYIMCNYFGFWRFSLSIECMVTHSLFPFSFRGSNWIRYGIVQRTIFLPPLQASNEVFRWIYGTCILLCLRNQAQHDFKAFCIFITICYVHMSTCYVTISI